MREPSENDIIQSLRRDEARLHAIEAMPLMTQVQYAVGIAKLKRRIYEERCALGVAPEDTEAWAKHLLEDIDVNRQSEGARHLIDQHLALVEAAREQADPQAMHEAQHGLERFIQEISEPEQLQFDQSHVGQKAGRA